MKKSEKPMLNIMLKKIINNKILEARKMTPSKERDKLINSIKKIYLNLLKKTNKKILLLQETDSNDKQIEYLNTYENFISSSIDDLEYLFDYIELYSIDEIIYEDKEKLKEFIDLLEEEVSEYRYKVKEFESRSCYNDEYYEASDRFFNLGEQYQNLCAIYYEYEFNIIFDRYLPSRYEYIDYIYREL